jgi:uncharacterized protein YkwD
LRLIAPSGETPGVTRRLAVAISLAAIFAGAGSAKAMKLSNLVAPPSVCRHQFDESAPAGVQERAMRCMTNFARRHAHRHGLRNTRPLDRSAGHKARDIIRCNSFSHYACGRDFTYWMQREGYLPARCWRAGENLAWGSGRFGSVRSIFKAWVHSPEHLANILGQFNALGVGLDIGHLDGFRRAHVWVQHFGAHC